MTCPNDSYPQVLPRPADFRKTCSISIWSRNDDNRLRTMRRPSFCSCIASAFVVAALVAPPAVGQDRATAERLEALNQETRKQLNGSGVADFVWWLPTDWWRLALSGNETVPEPFLQRTEAALADYTLVLIAHGDAGPDSLTWTDESALRADVTLLDRHGEAYPPIATELVAADARAAVEAIRPSFATLLGPAGRNFHFFFFPATTDTGTTIADPRLPGEISVRVVDQRYRWRLPLGALLPEKRCPVDGERLNGGWLFCPWHGDRLVAGD